MAKSFKKKRSHLTKTSSLTNVKWNESLWQIRCVAALCVLGFFIYANTLTSPFHWDDLAVVVNNPAIRNVWDWQALFNAFNTRFLVGLSLAVNYSFSELNVVGYHFLNIWFHVCNTVLIYALSYQIFSITSTDKSQKSYANLWKSFAASVVFLVHPLATQPVNYIWQRSVLMMTFFYLASIVLLIEYRRTSLRWMLGGALFSCFLAMFSKESAFVLPVMIVWLDWFFFKRGQNFPDKKHWIVWGCFLGTMTIIPLLLLRAEHLSLPVMKPFSLTQGVSADVISRMDYVLTQINVWMTYLRMFVVPVGLNIDHDYPLVAQSGWGYWLGALVFHGVILLGGIYQFRRNRLIVFVIVWFYMNVLLESIVTSRDLCVEHRVYLPMIGLCLLVSEGMWRFLAQRKQTWATVSVFVWVVVLGFFTIQRNNVWQDNFSLWNDAAKKSPMKARPLNNRGQILNQLGQIDLALADFNRAIALDPQLAGAYQNRGHILKLQSNWDAAFNDYSSVIRLEPENAQAYAYRGNIYKRKGELSQALDDYSNAVRLDPTNAEAYTNRGYLNFMLQQYDQALLDYQKALELNPQYVYALNNRGNLFVYLKNYKAAVSDYTHAITISPSLGEAYANRAVVYFQLGLSEESKKDVAMAQQLGQKVHEDFIRQLNGKKQ